MPPGKKKSSSDAGVLKSAREVLSIEAQAVKDQKAHIDGQFVRAVQILKEVTDSGGQVVVMGIGKSGLIGRKIAATLSSTGTPSLFFHPSEGLHGDLGMIQARDAILALSASGETEEIKKILPTLKERNLPLIALTAKAASRLGRAADVVIRTQVRKEACPMNLTPTASTTAMLALGDALAIALMQKRGFKPSDFARLHPGGSLGKKLFLKVSDLMHKGKENPVVSSDKTVRQALKEMTRTRLGATHVVNGKGELVGFFTDGDLRRKLEKGMDILNRRIKEVMTPNPTTITPDKTLHEALNLLRTRGFDNIPVVDGQGKPVGILDERDLLAEGV